MPICIGKYGKKWLKSLGVMSYVKRFCQERRWAGRLTVRRADPADEHTDDIDTGLPLMDRKG